MAKSYVKVALSTLACIAALSAILIAHDDDSPIQRVLLLSVDGLHASDLAWYVEHYPTSPLGQLSASGRTYSHATATMPSDSFPGMLAMVTGGTPRSTGVYYDDGYDRTLLASTAICGAVGQPAPGTRVQWKQNLDVSPTTLFQSFIDPAKLPLNPVDCSRVYPHQFPRVNNVFELVKAAGGRTAWSDKHPSYEFLNGPSGTGLDDLYTPEIASCFGTLPCSSSAVITNSFKQTMAYDDLKVGAILNEIHGLDHTGTAAVGAPAVFGMNFQAVSVGQKLSSLSEGVGGYVRDPATGVLTPSAPLQSALAHTDTSIGSMVTALRDNGLLDSTLIIISAKHGNSPIDPVTLVRVDSAVISAMVNSVAPGLALLSADTGPLIWLKDQSTTAQVVAVLDTPANRALAHIDRILWGPDLAALFVDPLTDSRTPDIALIATPGTVYTTSLTKIADHGSFSDDDAHVALLVSAPSMRMRTIDDPVETRQIACTILKSLSLHCDGLKSEQIEPSRALPHRNRSDWDEDAYDDDGHR